MKWIKDEEFIRGDIPMTKFNIRMLNIAYLRLIEGDRLLDIGAGTGSVSIEAAMQGIKTWAIEMRSDAVDLMIRNIEKFNVDVKIIKGQAPEDLPDMYFNKCFIGGSGGRLEEIFEYLETNLQHRGIVCGNFIMLKNLNKFMKQMEGYGYCNIETQLIQTSYMDNIGLLRSNNPIFIVKGEKK